MYNVGTAGGAFDFVQRVTVGFYVCLYVYSVVLVSAMAFSAENLCKVYSAGHRREPLTCNAACT